MDSVFIYLIIVEIFIIALIVGIKLLFNHLENKKIQTVLRFIDKKSRENIDGRADRIKECIEILNSKGEGNND